MKKTLVSLLTLLLIAGFAGSVLASSELEGKVTKVKGKTVTIEITKGKAAKLDVGSKVKIEAEEGKKAPKKGGDMLMGC